LLDALVIGLGSERMLAGLYGLFIGLRWVGFPAERTTVRLGLTLQAMERNSMKFRDLTEMLHGARTAGPETACYSLRHEAWRLRDTLVLAAALSLSIGVWLV
jgi:hypothetical protein